MKTLGVIFLLSTILVSTHAQDTLPEGLLRQVFIMTFRDELRKYNLAYTPSYQKSVLCGLQHPEVVYKKELESKGFGKVKFFRYRFRGIDCVSRFAGADDPQPPDVCNFAIWRPNTGSIEFRKIYKIAYFPQSSDFFEFLCEYLSYNSKEMKKIAQNEKYFLQRFFIETINMKALHHEIVSKYYLFKLCTKHTKRTKYTKHAIKK